MSTKKEEENCVGGKLRCVCVKTGKMGERSVVFFFFGIVERVFSGSGKKNRKV